jgi:hypothetical protein
MYCIVQYFSRDNIYMAGSRREVRQATTVAPDFLHSDASYRRQPGTRFLTIAPITPQQI